MEEERKAQEWYDRSYDEMSSQEGNCIASSSTEINEAALDVKEGKVGDPENTEAMSQTTGDKRTIIYRLKKKFRSRKLSEGATNNFINHDSETFPSTSRSLDSTERRKAFQRRIISLPAPNQCSEVATAETSFTRSSKRPRSKIFMSLPLNRVKESRNEDNLMAEKQERSSEERSTADLACNEKITENKFLPGQQSPDLLEEGQGAGNIAKSQSHQHCAEPEVSQSVQTVIESYDSVPSASDSSSSTEARDKLKVTLMDGLQSLSMCSWYWGPLTRYEAEKKLNGKPDGAFLVRDSSDKYHLLSMSFRTNGRTFHTRISHENGRFGFLTPSGVQGTSTIKELVERSMKMSKRGSLCFNSSNLFQFSIPVRFIIPLSRFDGLPSLQHLCKFVIRQNIRCDQVNQLPLPARIKEYLKGNYFLETE